jgi:hypothetical protein
MFGTEDYMNRVELVARTLCSEAGKTVSPVCVVCGAGECQYWKSFQTEARAVITALRKAGEM